MISMQKIVKDSARFCKNFHEIARLMLSNNETQQFHFQAVHWDFMLTWAEKWFLKLPRTMPGSQIFNQCLFLQMQHKFHNQANVYQTCTYGWYPTEIPLFE